MNNPTLKEAIKDGGYYGKNGIWNSILVFPDDPHIYRHRVETIVIRNKKEIFLKMKPDGSYYLPGGSVEKSRSDDKQALRECQEEAHMNVGNIRFSGISYKKDIGKKEWMEELPVKWDRMYTDIYCGTFTSSYSGVVSQYDEDPFIRSGRWYPIKKCLKIFSSEHRAALFWYMKEYLMEESVYSEGYALNYLKNRRFLKRIADHPELSKDAIATAYKKLNTFYQVNKKNKKYKPSEDEKPNEFTYFPLGFFEFKDGQNISLAVSFFDNKETPACAFHSTERQLDTVVLFPDMFELDVPDEVRYFVLLHEIGHCRLGHVKKKNQWTWLHAILFDKYPKYDHRVNRMIEGKVMYPELNADLYAVLNGSVLYAPLAITEWNDKYPLTNEEMANRYRFILRKYMKYRPKKESYENPYQYNLDDYVSESPSSGNMVDRYKGLKDSEFGLPKERKYPLDTKQHVLSAIRLFGHCPDNKQEELARNLCPKITEYHIDPKRIGKKNPFYTYWHAHCVEDMKKWH